MKIGGLYLFEKNSLGSRLWCAYHPSNSLAWTWLFSIESRAAAAKWFEVLSHKDIDGSQTCILIGGLVLRNLTQRPMSRWDLKQGLNWFAEAEG